jgi:hypothetical protein
MPPTHPLFVVGCLLLLKEGRVPELILLALWVLLPFSDRRAVQGLCMVTSTRRCELPCSSAVK